MGPPQIGTDGGFLNRPVELDSLLLGPAERADVIVDFHGYGGETLVLLNNAATPFPGNATGLELPELIQFRVSRKGGSRHPYQLPCFQKVPRAPEDPFDLGYPYHIAKERDLTLVEINSTSPDGTPIVIPTLSGLRFHDPPTETPRVNTVELWRLINLTPDTHPIHLHLSQFRLLERRPFDVAAYDANGEIVYTGPPLPPDPNENGYKDTIRANPDEVTTILVPFEDYTGNYVWHCHILEHEDNDMMRPLVISYSDIINRIHPLRQEVVSVEGKPQ
ncbi:Multicopper oxidase, type 2 [Acanthamoeba castellanii str. Neff]|uniref:Multicopper oxidase, type 2 n=1 Tax=Acanthamoeba castellanii (strain ATCC 30010 / Neff) TaxID=1257118 RepID=L8GLX6_ACACF|nr:Multicopper oxidase, type 2 [Acanthamoeba castellanii str. Neff]ELR13728.1 Multicopper oxidase, type 2 [Acanthamoeba castellanii str. Neff]